MNDADGAGLEPLEDRAYEQLRARVRRLSGVLLRDAQRSFAERRWGARARALGLEGLVGYARLVTALPDGHEEVALASEAVTTRETFFFRDARQLAVLREAVLPALYRERAGARRLRCWSAGCASGEEAYTLAMVLLDAGLPAGWDVSVLGTDLSREALVRAREGRYASGALRGEPPSRWGRHLTEVSPESLAVSPEVRALCRFARVNLVDADSVASVGRVDLALCRNVLIHLAPEARAAVLSHLRGRLAPWGRLFLGASELPREAEGRFVPESSGGVVWFRPVGADRWGGP